MKSCFENKDLYVGIDVHKKRWVVTVRTYDLELKTFSMDAGAEELERFFVDNYTGALLHIVYDPPRRTAFLVFGSMITFIREVLISL
jgi:hypothetical protein